jgi:hypothetical protein
MVFDEWRHIRPMFNGGAIAEEQYKDSQASPALYP